MDNLKQKSGNVSVNYSYINIRDKSFAHMKWDVTDDAVFNLSRGVLITALIVKRTAPSLLGSWRISSPDILYAETFDLRGRYNIAIWQRIFISNLMKVYHNTPVFLGVLGNTLRCPRTKGTAVRE